MFKIHTVCDGGAANRCIPLASVLSCVEIDTLFWKSNNWCGASFFDFFENPYFKVEEKGVGDLNHLPDDFIFHFHEAFKGINDNRLMTSCHNPPQSNAVIMCNGEIKWADTAYGFEYLSSIIRKDLISRAKAYGKFELGIPLRATDGNNMSVNQAEAIEKALECEGRVFVTSDSEVAESAFMAATGAVRQENKEYVTKFVDNLGWTDTIADSEGRIFPFNVNRGRKHCIDAFVDLLILSQCEKIIGNENSSYYRMAKYLSNFKLW